MTNSSETPLPSGWIRQTHRESGQPFYVDTKADPPRSIWLHPYEDEQYLNEHPDIREKVAPSSKRSSYNHSSRPARESTLTRTPSRKRGFLGKIKDKMIGTKEEREAEKRRVAMLEEQCRQQWMAQTSRAAQFGDPQYHYGQSQYGYGQPQAGRMGGTGGRRALGMGGMALPLVGGLAGGLLLGDMLDGGFSDNDYDGGQREGEGFDGGGDFGGDSFGGGGF